MSPNITEFLLPKSAFMLGLPRLIFASSMTSSCSKLARWMSSMIAQSLREISLSPAIFKRSFERSFLPELIFKNISNAPL